MKTLLTVDWDFFVPEKRDWDFGHREAIIFITDMWMIRAGQFIARDVDPLKEIKTNKLEKSFWQNLFSSRIAAAEDAKIYVTESHIGAYELFNENSIGDVYNFDAHSDLGYSSINGLYRDENIDCGNWLGIAALRGIINKATVIYSPNTLERKGQFKEQIDTLGINVLSFNEFMKKSRKQIKVDIFHICRSGAWTPPWLDSNFLDFVNELTKIINKKPEKIDLIERNFDLAAAQQQGEEIRGFIKSAMEKRGIK